MQCVYFQLIEKKGLNCKKYSNDYGTYCPNLRNTPSSSKIVLGTRYRFRSSYQCNVHINNRFRNTDLKKNLELQLLKKEEKLTK